MARIAFAPYYSVYITYENNEAARDEGMPELTEVVKLPAGARTVEGDLAALKAAKEMADARSVGAEGRVVFKEYVVYVTFKPSVWESELLATVVRGYCFDESADFTYGKNHCGHVARAVIDAVFPA